jgi:hypothetical protein
MTEQTEPDGAVLTGSAAAGDVWGAATAPASPPAADEAAADEAPGHEPEARDATPAPPRPAPAGRAPVRPRPAPPRRPAPPGPDLLGDLQRWLIRSGARSVRREVEDQVRRTLGGGRGSGEDVWGRATTEPPPDLSEAPECAWCPVCRAARRMRVSGPDLSSQLAGASGAVATAVQDALGAVDAILSRPGAGPGPRRPADTSPEPGTPTTGTPGTGTPDSAGDHAERVADEPGDRG